jgi:hypothetical protein
VAPEDGGFLRQVADAKRLGDAQLDAVEHAAR